jgi:hypothetical protein
MADQALGPVGDGDPKTPKFDAERTCEDFFFLPATEAASTGLKLDERVAPKTGEKVWFPNKNFDSPEGYDWMEGTIESASSEKILVRLPGSLKLQSQSGTPFISAATGRVIGVLVGASREAIIFGNWIIEATPASCLRRGLESPRKLMQLADAAKAELGK